MIRKSSDICFVIQLNKFLSQWNICSSLAILIVGKQ
jgi:hypothetical protein